MTIRLVVLLALVVCLARPAEGQRKRAEAALLGAASGAVWGSVGGFYPCSSAARVEVCRGAVIGALTVSSGLGGALLGSDAGQVDAAIRRSSWTGLGFGVLGAALMLTDTRLVVSWRDVLALAAVGFALGGPAVGAGIGFGLGITIEGLRWALGGEGGWLDMGEGGIIGAALGAAGWWLFRGIDAGGMDRPASIGVSLSLPR